MKKETNTTTKKFTLTDMLGNNETTFIGDRQKLENKFNYEMDELNDPTENKDFFEWCMDSVEKAPLTTTKGEFLQGNEYKNMPDWNALKYASWRQWAKECFDAGKKESEERVKYLENLIKEYTDKMLKTLNK